MGLFNKTIITDQRQFLYSRYYCPMFGPDHQLGPVPMPQRLENIFDLRNAFGLGPTHIILEILRGFLLLTHRTITHMRWVNN